MVERRVEPREAVMLRIEVCWQGAAGAQQTLTAVVEDKSSRGLSFRVEAPIPIGARVLIESPREKFSGVVMYCRKSRKGYVLGVQRHGSEAATAADESTPRA